VLAHGSISRNLAPSFI